MYAGNDKELLPKLLLGVLGQSTVLQGRGRIPPINIDRKGGFRPGGYK